MKYLSYLAAPASWVFLPVMTYLSRSSWEAGLTVFWAGAIVLSCGGVSLLLAGLVKHQLKSAVLGIFILVPVVLSLLQLPGRIDEMSRTPSPADFCNSRCGNSEAEFQAFSADFGAL